MWLWSAIEFSTGVMCACGPALKALWLHVKSKPVMQRLSDRLSAIQLPFHLPSPRRLWPGRARRGSEAIVDVGTIRYRRDSAWLAKVQGLEGSTGDYDGTKSCATVVRPGDCGWWQRSRAAGGYDMGKEIWSSDSGTAECCGCLESRLGPCYHGHAGPVGVCEVIMVSECKACLA